MREAAVQQRVLLEHCTATRGQMWVNKSGALTDEHGRMIRYGLGHSSAQQVRSWASSDLIGITPTLITPEMVGYYLGVFTAYEVKHPGWKLQPSDDRAHAQQRYMQIVRDACGFAGFVTDPREIYPIIRRG